MLTRYRARRLGLLASCAYHGVAMPWLFAPHKFSDTLPRIVYQWPHAFIARPVAAP